jgi:hypothetical protein
MVKMVSRVTLSNIRWTTNLAFTAPKKPIQADVRASGRLLRVIGREIVRDNPKEHLL